MTPAHFLRRPYLGIQAQVAVVLQRLHQQRQQRFEALAAEPITRLPQRHQRRCSRRTVATAVMRLSVAWVIGTIDPSLWFCGGALIEQPQQGFAVLAR